MLRYAIPTLIAMALLVGGVAVLASQGETIDNPFGEYETLTPGQPAIALAQFHCYNVYIPPDISANVAYCQIRPESGPILLVGITVIDDTIQALSFSVKGLQAGHLVQRWGRPDQIRSAVRFSLLDWKEGISATVQTSGWFTYQSSLSIVNLSSGDANSTLS